MIGWVFCAWIEAGTDFCSMMFSGSVYEHPRVEVCWVLLPLLVAVLFLHVGMKNVLATRKPFIDGRGAGLDLLLGARFPQLFLHGEVPSLTHLSLVVERAYIHSIGPGGVCKEKVTIINLFFRAVFYISSILILLQGFFKTLNGTRC